MSSVTFSENHKSLLISFEDGRALLNTQDPQGEGLRWVYSLGAIPTNEVVVVGLGSGFHIAALLDVQENLTVKVVESRDSLVRIFENQFPDIMDRVEIITVQKAQDLFRTDFFNEVLEQRPYVLSFRECWGSQGDFFSEVFAHLTGRSIESVRYHFEEFGINIKSTFNNLLSLKEVLPSLNAEQMSSIDRQVFGVLGELVK